MASLGEIEKKFVKFIKKIKIKIYPYFIVFRIIPCSDSSLKFESD